MSTSWSFFDRAVLLMWHSIQKHEKSWAARATPVIAIHVCAI